MKEKSFKMIYWVPRIFCILFILFTGLFAFEEQVFGGAFFIHLIPTAILFIILVISWKFELVGGTIFIILGIIWTFFYSTFENMLSFLLLSLPIILIGFLFLWNYLIHKETN